MANYKTAKMVRHKNHFACQMCSKNKLSKMYEYQSISYVREYIPYYNTMGIIDEIEYKKILFNQRIKETKNKIMEIIIITVFAISFMAGLYITLKIGGIL